jgi:AcrR family transcriptional regulator
MSPAAVYVHWKAKHDLLFEISRIGHQAVLDVVEQALDEASGDPVERVHAFVSAFASYHALARVIQYEFKEPPRGQFRQIVGIRDRFEELMRAELTRGVAAGVFDVADVEGTTLAVLSLCIGLGPGVLVPSLRHPMVNAAATANLVALAPERVVVAFGTGFSGRRAMGYRAIPWAFMDAYIRAYRGLLRGETIEWEGARMRMLHPDGHGAPRPIEVPISIAALGPKGAGVARELGDGLYITLALPEFATEFSWVS